MQELTTSLPYPEKRRYISPAGYNQIYVDGRGLILEHRLVMERHLGRPLTDEEHIHHKNGDKLDNRVENLQIISNAEHGRLHSTKYSDEFLLESLRELARRVERVPQLLDCDANKDLPSRICYQRHFGTWNNALKLAGFPQHKPRRKHKQWTNLKQLTLNLD